jgi:hypothetical protein
MIKTNENHERRRERRLRYQWPVWFAEDVNEVLSQGQMVDITSESAAFTCHSHDTLTFPGQKVTLRLSIPKFSDNDAFELACYVRKGNVYRIEEIDNYTRRIVTQFAEPLPYKPGEQIKNDIEENHLATALTI